MPDKEKNPTLFKIVFSNLILGPCWKNYNEKAPSFENNTYKKHYPKDFNNSSYFNFNNFPVFKRMGTELFKKGKHKVDNRWVVPYNSYLCFT